MGQNNPMLKEMGNLDGFSQQGLQGMPGMNLPNFNMQGFNQNDPMMQFQLMQNMGNFKTNQDKDDHQGGPNDGQH
jgi:hypothetical protein